MGDGKRICATFPEDASTMSVAEFKSSIREHFAIPRNKQISLVLDDASLQDGRTLLDVGVVDGSVLNLVVAQGTWLEALQEEAILWPCGGEPNSSADLVSEDMHRKLLAGERLGHRPSTV